MISLFSESKNFYRETVNSLIWKRLARSKNGKFCRNFMNTSKNCWLSFKQQRSRLVMECPDLYKILHPKILNVKDIHRAKRMWKILPFLPGSARSSTSLATAYDGNPVYKEIDSSSCSKSSKDGGWLLSFNNKTSFLRIWISSSGLKSVMFRVIEEARVRLPELLLPIDVADSDREARPEQSK